MRFSHWLKTLASTAVLSVGAGSAMAQDAGYPGTGQPMFQPAYSTNDPGVLYPQGVPQGFNPYPAISPYGMGNVAWDQTYQDSNGLWYEQILNRNREYFGSIDVTYNTTKNPGNRELGSPHIPLDPISGGLVGYEIPTYGQGATPGAGTTTGGTTGLFSGTPDSYYVADRRVLPYPLFLGGTLFVVDNELFPIRGMDAFGNYRSGGIHGTLGFFNEDGTGMSVSAFWSGQDTQSFTMGTDAINGIPINQDMILTSEGRLLFTRNGAIPLNWGFFGTAAVGTNITTALGTTKYDVLFHYDTKTSVIGGDANFYFAPVIRRPAMKIRPFLGGRYTLVDDQFSFRGIDSGFIYGITRVVAVGGGGGGTTVGNTFRPDPDTLIAQYDLYEATLRNTVQTHLAGPQVGFRYDLGDGDGFKMWGQSIAGVMANREEYHLWGNNIGDQAGLTQMGTGINMLAEDARFDKRYSVNRVSPLFEQSINAEMKILEMIPGIRRLPGIEDTVFKVGYTITVVGGVARAADSIDWRGFPYFPGIDPGRQTWWTSRWNFGIERRF